MRPMSGSAAEGARAAAAEHARLPRSDGPVDIFNVIERAGIWLMFQPLKNLYGAYERAGDTAGIIINAQQPWSLQRFTAAHEYGHHVLGHAPSLDDESNIQPAGKQLTPDEHAAHSFAAHFLMPLERVDAALGRLGLAAQPLAVTPTEAYLLSLDLGVSYAATVNQLLALGKIDGESAAALRAYSVKQIKAEIVRRPRPRSDRVDTWLLREQDAGRRVYPRVNDELVALLPEIPSSGYLWSPAGPDVADARGQIWAPARIGEAPLVLTDEEFVAAGGDGGGPRYGGGGTRRLVVKVLRAGQHRLRLAKRRPWEGGASPAATWEVELRVVPQPTGASRWGLSERQKPLLAVAGA